jgi:DNA topoisomerase IB
MDYLGPVGDAPSLSQSQFQQEMYRKVIPRTGKRLREKETPTIENTRERFIYYKALGLDLKATNKNLFSEWLAIWDDENPGVSPDDTFEKESTFRVHKVIDDVEEQYRQDLARMDDSKEWATATVVALINELDFRPGNRKADLGTKGHVGAITQRIHNVQINDTGDRVTFDYVGKAGQSQKRSTQNPLLVDAVKKHLKNRMEDDEDDIKFRDWLFKYQGQNGVWYPLSDETVRDYLKRWRITPKQIRTYKANVHFIKAYTGQASVKKNDPTAAVNYTARQLGNKPATAKKSYIDTFLLHDLRIVQKNLKAKKHSLAPPKLPKKKGK